MKIIAPYKEITIKGSLISRLSFIIVFIYFGVFTSCNSNKDKLLAKVYNERLYLSQTEGVVPPGTIGNDSIIMLNTFVEQWVREKLFEHDAEIRLPNKEEIDKQVEKYRTSLINFAYEEFLIKQQMDTIVSGELLQNFYDQNKEQFKLESAIIRCNFIKVPKAKIKEMPIDEYWKSNKAQDRKQLIDFCRENAQLFMLDDTLWYNMEEIYFQLPKGKIERSNLEAGKQWKIEDEDNMYYLKIIKMIPAGNQAPLSYASTQITKIINYKKKKELVDKFKDQVLERESRKTNYKIYINRPVDTAQNK